MTSPLSNPPRQRSRLGRILLFLALGLVALIVLLLAILPSVVSLEKFRGQITAKAEEALHRKVEIGDIRLQIFSGLGAGLNQLTIANQPGWQRPHFVKVGTLSVKIAFWPLLQRRIEVSKVILSDGDIVIERDAKGRMNYDDLTQTQPAPSRPAPRPKAGDTTPNVNPLAGLLVANLALRNIDITFVDQMVVPGKSVTTNMRDVEVNVDNFALNTPIDLDIAASLLSDTSRNIRLQGRLGPIPDTLDFARTPLQFSFKAQELQLDKLTPYMGPEPALISGRFSTDLTLKGSLGSTLELDGSYTLAQVVLPPAASGEQPTQLPDVRVTQDITVDMAQAVVDLTAVRLALATLEATLQGKVRQFTTKPTLDLTLQTNTVKPEALLAQLPMLAEALPEATKVTGDVTVQTSIKGTPDRLTTDTRLTSEALSLRSGTFSGAKKGGGMQLETAKTRLNLQARVVAKQQPDVRMELHTDRLVFNQQADVDTAAPAPAKPKPDTPSARTSMAPPLDVRGKVTIGEGQITNLRFRDLQADVSVIKGLLQSTQTFKLFGGAYEGNIRSNLAQADPDYTIKAKLANIDARAATNELTSVHNALHGLLNTELNISGQGFDWDSISKTLTGGGKVQIAKLKLTTLDIMPKVAAGLQTTSTLAGFNVPPDLAERSFETLQGSFRVLKGKILSDDLQLLGQDLQLSGKGVLGLDQSLSFDGAALLLGKLAGSFGKRAAFLQDKAGRIRLPLAISGTVTKPTIGLNQSYLTDLAKKSLQDKAGEGVQQLLQKALPKQKSDKEPATTDTTKQPAPQQQLEKTLKGLFKR